MSSASVFHICISTWRHTIRAILSLVARVCSAKRPSLSLPRSFATSVAASKRHYGKVPRLALVRRSADKRELPAARTGLVLDRAGRGGDQLDQESTGHSRCLVAVDRIARSNLREFPVDHPAMSGGKIPHAMYPNRPSD